MPVGRSGDFVHIPPPRHCEPLTAARRSARLRDRRRPESAFAWVVATRPRRRLAAGCRVRRSGRRLGEMSLFRARTWKETLHLLLDLPVGIAGFTLVLTGLATAAGLLVTFLGIPLLTATLLLSRLAGRGELGRARALLGVELQPPRPLPRQRGGLARLFAPIRDGAAWRSALYFLLMLPVGVVTFTVALTWWATALGAL